MQGSYFAPIEESNLTFMHDRPVRASLVGGLVPGTSPGREYATEATFDIPGDARGGFITIQADGPEVSENDPYLPLVAPGIQYSNIWGLSWAPSTGRFWVSADNQIDEIDLFRFDPTRTTFASNGTQPRISRPTLAGQILSVDSLMGVPIVEKISVADGTVSFFANTHDDDFTREILPVGIAVEPDGSACYIADASEGKIVKIPAGNSSPIEDEWGGKTDWSFPNPCGIDASPNSRVWASDASGAIFWATETGTQFYNSLPYVVKAIHVDRDISTDGIDRFFFGDQPGFTEAFNMNPIGYGWNGTTVANEVPARHLGGFVWGLSDGRLMLTNENHFEFEYHKPEAVLVSNADPSFPFLSDRQVSDRVIEFSVLDPFAIPLHLRLLDPPDLAPYDDKNLDDPAGFTAPLAKFPYEANDNHISIDDCVSAGECGLSLSPDGSGAARELIADPSNPVFLKIPDDFSGENFLVQVSKVDPATLQMVPNRVLTLGPVFTSWKRILVERGIMHRAGGLLARDYVPDPGCTNDCNRIEVFSWADVAVGDFVVLSDARGLLSETAFVSGISAGPGSTTNYLFLEDGLPPVGDDYIPVGDYQASASNQGQNDPELNLEVGASAGIGVISDCDPDPRVINGNTSCYYQGDMRLTEPVFGDAFVDIGGALSGTSFVPYYPGEERESSGRWFFAWQWFDSKNQPGFVHLLGAERILDHEDAFGVSVLGNSPAYPAPIRSSYALIRRIEEVIENGDQQYCFFTYGLSDVQQDISAHELVHQFAANEGSTKRHCYSSTWTDGGGCLLHTFQGLAHCPGRDPVRLDANEASTTSANGGDVYDVRININPFN